MKPAEIKYTRRYNVGAYEHEEYEIHARLDEDGKESPIKALVELRHTVDEAHHTSLMGPPAHDPAADQEGTPDVVANTQEEKPKKSPKNKKSATAKPEAKNEVGDDGADSYGPTVTIEEVDDVLPPPKKKFKKKAETYDRGNEIHRKLFVEELMKYDKNYKQNKEASKTTSKSLEGTDFLDAEGTVLPTFVKAMRDTYLKLTKKKK